MKTLCFISALVWSFQCFSQDTYLIIGELRLGYQGQWIVPFQDPLDEASFRALDLNYNPIDGGVQTTLSAKENFDRPWERGTEIRFTIKKNLFGRNRSINLFGELYTYLPSSQGRGTREKIIGRFRKPITIDLSPESEYCQKIGEDTYKLKNPIKIHAPEKYSLASMINHLRRTLFENRGEVVYQRDVEQILQFDLKTSMVDRALKEKAYVLYDFIRPYTEVGGYYENEKKRLDQYLQELQVSIAAYGEARNLQGDALADLNQLRRDSFESALVAQEYGFVMQDLRELKPKLEEILFKPDLSSSPTEPSRDDLCEKNIDFSVGGVASFGRNSVQDPFVLVPVPVTEFVEIVDDTDGFNSSFSVVGMTNFYLKKRRKINPGLCLGLGLNFQEDITIGAFLGGAIAFSEERKFVVNFGMSSLPVRELINNEIGDFILSSSSSDEISRTVYKWSPFISLGIPIPRIKPPPEEKDKNPTF